MFALMTALSFSLPVFWDAPIAKTVHFDTKDKIKIEADYFPPPKSKEKAPAAILIHMYPADRKSWDVLAPALQEAGFAVLAYDIRGKGGSANSKDASLSKRYEEKDKKHFESAWHDTAAAAKWLADQKEVDASRIVLIGASIGCTISLEYANHSDAVRAVVCLSPGAKYFGIDSVAAIKRVKTKKIMLIAPEAEQGDVRTLVKASGDIAVVGKYPGTREQHGTNILSDSYPRGAEIRKAIVDFVAEAVQLKSQPAGHKKSPDGH